MSECTALATKPELEAPKSSINSKPDKTELRKAIEASTLLLGGTFVTKAAFDAKTFVLGNQVLSNKTLINTV